MASIEPSAHGVIRVLCSDPEATPELERAFAERFGNGIDWRLQAALDRELDERLRRAGTGHVRMTR